MINVQDFVLALTGYLLLTECHNVSAPYNRFLILFLWVPPI